MKQQLRLTGPQPESRFPNKIEVEFDTGMESEVAKWAEKNSKGDFQIAPLYHHIIKTNKTIVIYYFELEKDAIAFRLRW